MPIGIEKIVVVKDGIEQNWASFWIRPDFYYEIRVKYFPETPETLKGHAKWILKPETGGIFSSVDQDGRIGDTRNISIEAKFCGPKRFVLEAFDDEPLNRFPTQLKFWGKAPEKIVSTKWSRTNGGDDIRGSKLKYGDPVWLNVQTEGLNGAKLDIDVYNRRSVVSDEKAATLNGVDCNYGEVNVEIKNTYAWREFTGLTTSNSGEEFYVKIRLSGKTETLLDDHNDDEHARYLTIEDEISTRDVETHQSAQPLTVEENEVNVERFELCHFKKIDITDDGAAISIFDEGKIIDEKASGEFHFSESIHFDVDKSDIRSVDIATLDNVANLLLENPFIPAEIGAHCDIRASHDYNDALSFRRAIAAKNYLVNKGVNADKIIANGYGKRRLLIAGEELSEEEHEVNRRLTLRFKISGEDSSTIIYQTIAPDITKKKKIAIDVSNYETDKCLRINSSDEHTTDVKVIGITTEGVINPRNYSGTDKFEHEVYSTLSSTRFLPFDYILPHKSSTNKFEFYINSCRYYFKNNNPTINVIVFPDIKWDFHFFLNLSNSPSVKWQALGHAKHAEMQQKAGHIGAEKRLEQVNIDFGAILEAKWNKINEKDYHTTEELTVRFDSKIRRFYDIFATLKDASKIITEKTKGKAVSTLGSRFPLGVEVLPPNFCFGAEWQLARGFQKGKNTKELGTLLKFYFKAEPLIGLELTLDLLQAAIGATGPAAPILSAIRYWLGDEDTSDITVDLYVNLVIFGIINIPNLELKYNTASDDTDPNQKASLEATATIGLRLEAGLVVKAKMAVIVAEFYAQAYAKFEGTGSITFGHGLTYQSQKLFYRPKLMFDGVVAKVEIKAEIGLEIKKGWFEGNYSKDLTDFKEEYNLVDPFDVVKAIENATGVDANIPLIG